MFLIVPIFFSNSSSPIITTCFTSIRLASRNCAFKLRPNVSSITFLLHVFLIVFANLNAIIEASSLIVIKYISGVDSIAFILSIAKINLSTPAAKPTAGVDFPPIYSMRLLYLPPPQRASCAPNVFDVISKVVWL